LPYDTANACVSNALNPLNSSVFLDCILVGDYGHVNEYENHYHYFVEKIDRYEIK